MKIKPDKLASEITKALRTYTSEVEKDILKVEEKVASDAVQRLRTNSPEDTGDYRKGWRMKREGKKIVIYNATDASLTHLLEKGHAQRGGGRVAPRVHIAPVEEKAIDEFITGVEKVVKR